jgi:[acyl-carrier-protein] S-malonyltransferase
MQRAAERLSVDLRELAFHEPEIPVVSNVDASEIANADAARDALIRQVTGAVKWDPSMRWLMQHRVETFVEVGPGRVLTGLLRQIERSKKCYNVADQASLEKALAALCSPPVA